MAWDLIGHRWSVELLKREVKRQRVRHAYLLAGPDGVGKRTLALRFAQALACASPPRPGDMCEACRACQGIPENTFADLHVVEAESKGGTLKVDQIRELQHHLALTPREAKRRIALLLRFHEASEGAANALLKTLEEPPAGVVLILTARSAEALPPTVPSRCVVVPMRTLPGDELRRALCERGVDEALAVRLAGLAGGRPGEALRLLSDKEALAERSEWLEGLRQLLRGSRRERFVQVEGMSRDRARAISVLQVWQGFVRDVVLAASGAVASSVHTDLEAEVRRVASPADVGAWVRAARALDKTLEQIEQNANLRLALEVLTLEMPYLSG